MALYRITYAYDAARQDRRGFVSQHASGLFRAHSPVHAQVMCRIVVEELGGRNMEILEVEEVTLPEGEPL